MQSGMYQNSRTATMEIAHSRPFHGVFAQPYERDAARGLQYFSGVPDEDIVGKPYRHMAADMQACADPSLLAAWVTNHTCAQCAYLQCIPVFSVRY